jgi:4-amino-4-deoxy-L-arabinose transferase-like glycosyltransferase
LIFGSSAMVIVSAKMCLTDAVMMVFITGAQFCLYGIYRQNNPRRFPFRLNEPAPPAQAQKHNSLKLPLLFWLCIALAALTKGPFALVVLFASMIALAVFDVGRRWRSAAAWRSALAWWPRTRPLLGLAVIVIVVAPWLIAFAVKDTTNLLRMLNQPFEHLAHNRDGHAGYPGYYLLTIWVTFFPWSLLLPTAIVLGLRHRATPQIRFALATILGNWVFIELMVTKLPHYLLPSYAALAFLVATALIRNMRGQYRDFAKTPFLIATVCWTVAASLLATVLWLPIGFFPEHFPVKGAAAFSIVGILYAILVAAYFIQRQYARAAATMGLGMIAVILILFSLYLPNARFIRMSHDAGTRLAELGATGPDDAVMTDFDEPTLAFYQGGTIDDAKKSYLFDTPADQWPRYVVLTRQSLKKLPPEKQSRLQELAHYPGFNYAGGGKIVDVLVATKIPAPATQPTSAAHAR